MKENAEHDYEKIAYIANGRITALVTSDFEMAEKLHAPNFSVILPTGGRLSREQYFSAIEHGHLKYLIWEPQLIDISPHAEVAIVRYKSIIRIRLGGYNLPVSVCWHTDLYQRNASGWRAIWSQATQVI